ncbi:hypothetical protein O3Q50_00095 [Enterococcus lactis]
MDALEKRKEELFDLPVIEEVDDVKKCIWLGKAKIPFVNGVKSGMTYLLPHSLN